MFFKKKNIDAGSESLSALTWRRFKRNKLAMLGLLMIALATLGFNLLGDGLRDALDPRLRT